MIDLNVVLRFRIIEYQRLLLLRVSFLVNLWLIYTWWPWVALNSAVSRRAMKSKWLFFGRNGGGIGDGDIRKMVYFESSIDPSFTRSEVCPIYFSDFFPQPPGVAFRMVLDTSLSFHLKNCFSFSKGRDKTRVIVYRCPGNTAVQVTYFSSILEHSCKVYRVSHSIQLHLIS